MAKKFLIFYHPEEGNEEGSIETGMIGKIKYEIKDSSRCSEGQK